MNYWKKEKSLQLEMEKVLSLKNIRDWNLMALEKSQKKLSNYKINFDIRRQKLIK